MSYAKLVLEVIKLAFELLSYLVRPALWRLFLTKIKQNGAYRAAAVILVLGLIAIVGFLWKLWTPTVDTSTNSKKVAIKRGPLYWGKTNQSTVVAEDGAHLMLSDQPMHFIIESAEPGAQPIANGSKVHLREVGSPQYVVGFPQWEFTGCNPDNQTPEAPQTKQSDRYALEHGYGTEVLIWFKDPKEPMKDQSNIAFTPVWPTRSQAYLTINNQVKGVPPGYGFTFVNNPGWTEENKPPLAAYEFTIETRP